MADQPRPWRLKATLAAVTSGLVLIGGYGLAKRKLEPFSGDTSVYSVAYEKPSGWKEIPPGPFTLFIFREPTGKGTLRASVNEVQASMNPTPELDTDGIANHYVGLTEQNMPDWTAERLPDLKGGTESFSLIKRTKKDRTVYTAFCAKGNTTIVVSLTGGGKQVAGLDELLPDFRKLVASFRLTKKNIELDD